MIINHVAVLVPRVLLVPGFESKWGMDAVYIDVVYLQSSQTCLEGGSDAFGTMIGVPQLGTDKNVLSLDLALLEPPRIASPTCSSFR